MECSVPTWGGKSHGCCWLLEWLNLDLFPFTCMVLSNIIWLLTWTLFSMKRAKHTHYIILQHWRLGGRGHQRCALPMGGQISFIFIQFSGKNDQLIAFHAYLRSWHPHPGEILYPPLSSTSSCGGFAKAMNMCYFRILSLFRTILNVSNVK